MKFYHTCDTILTGFACIFNEKTIVVRVYLHSAEDISLYGEGRRPKKSLGAQTIRLNLKNILCKM